MRCRQSGRHKYSGPITRLRFQFIACGQDWYSAVSLCGANQFARHKYSGRIALPRYQTIVCFCQPFENGPFHTQPKAPKFQKKPMESRGFSAKYNYALSSDFFVSESAVFSAASTMNSLPSFSSSVTWPPFGIPPFRNVSATRSSTCD